MKYVLVIISYNILFLIGVKSDAAQDNGWLMAAILLTYLAGWFFILAYFMATEGRYSSVGLTISKAWENFRWLIKTYLAVVVLLFLAPTAIGLIYYFLFP